MKGLSEKGKGCLIDYLFCSSNFEAKSCFEQLLQKLVFDRNILVIHKTAKRETVFQDHPLIQGFFVRVEYQLKIACFNVFVLVRE